MADSRQSPCGHRVLIEERERIMIGGVTEVISFDEESIVCETDMGTLIVKGSELHVEKLNLDQGELNITGEIESLEYGAEGAFSKSSGGILGRIFK